MTQISVLRRAKPTEVVAKPFPHLVLENALPQDLYDELARTLPSRTEIGITETRNNRHWDYRARQAAFRPRAMSTPRWCF